MTDTDLEIDPALDAHLRRTLHAVAATVLNTETASDNVVRLVTTPALSAPRHRWAWLSAAAAAGMVAGAGLMAVADRDTDTADVPTASTGPAVEADPTLDALAQACAADIAQQMAAFPYEIRESLPALPNADTATVLLFDTQAAPPHQQLLVVGEASYIVCEVGRSSAVAADVNVYQIPALAPENDGVLVTDRTSWTGADPLHGPGWARVIGRVGSQVDAIDLEWTDGTIVSGQIQRGWFVIEGPIPPGVLDSDERLRWTADGVRQSSRADLLDAPDETEACAAMPGCVATRLNELHSPAQQSGLDEQAAILADGAVSDEEYDAALRRFAACFNAADTGATAVVHGGGNLAIGTSGIDDGAERAYMDAVHTLCSAAHLDLVDDAWTLLDAQRRVADG